MGTRRSTGDNKAAQGTVTPGCCFECGAPADHWHHVVPRVLGGTKTLPLCEGCHGKVHSRDMTNHRQLTKAAMAVKKAKGERTGAIPYGYRLSADGKTLEAHEGEQIVISVIKALRSQGLSLRAIADELIAARHTARDGGDWHKQRVWRVLAALPFKHSSSELPSFASRSGGRWYASQVARVLEAN